MTAADRRAPDRPCSGPTDRSLARPSQDVAPRISGRDIAPLNSGQDSAWPDFRQNIS